MCFITPNHNLPPNLMNRELADICKLYQTVMTNIELLVGYQILHWVGIFLRLIA